MMTEIRAALTEAKAVTGQPTLIIGKTIMGKGARKADDTAMNATVLHTVLLWVVRLISIPSRT